MADVTKEKKQRSSQHNSVRHPGSIATGENTRKRPSPGLNQHVPHEQDLVAVEVEGVDENLSLSRQTREPMDPSTAKITKAESSDMAVSTSLPQKKADYSDPIIEQDLESQSEFLDDGEYPSVDQNTDAKEFVVRISQSLRRKISRQAHDEGLSTEEFVAELLAEGVVVRAWEIVERKNQMRGLPSNPQTSNRGSNNSNNSNNSNSNSNSNSNQYGRNQNNRKPNHRGGMSHTRYQSIMDDKATFLEYVRQQERNRR